MRLMNPREAVPPKTAALMQALDEFRAARLAEVPLDACVNGLAEVLRDLWPPKRSHTLDLLECAACDDTGLVRRECTHDDRCPTHRRRLLEESYAHRYGEPCVCPAGVRFRITADAE